ncbi:hypothetical protein PIB30_081239 [Stylosanthes scabra]|uniref:Ribosomal protein S24e family protein n=1 Tax=Stylosanthes scabra TaxID=79078 RepID=A0ABU6WRJ3_9FABA|nr:hypothetical protein [Stylosanthes scabra]
MNGVVRAAVKRAGSHPLPIFTHQRLHSFSTGTVPPPHNPTNPSFFDSPNTGLAYGRLLGIHKHTLKTDVINCLQGLNLTLHDVKMEYTRTFLPRSMMVQFPSQHAMDEAVRILARKGRLFKLERVNREEWDIVTPYNGRTILIQGIPGNAQFVDIERILSGCEYEHSSINVFTRPSAESFDLNRMATVRFPSSTQAMNAFISKNGTYCVNNRISIQVLQ